MARNLIATISGLIFGLGLCISQMVNPKKVIDFLDFMGTWDPSLAFVMGGGVLVYLAAWRFKKTRSRPLFDNKFIVPSRSSIDPYLLGGAALFGLGWGMAGLCPGPSIASLSYLISETFIFVSAMVLGIYFGGFFLPKKH